MLCMLDTIVAKKRKSGGCALGRECKRKSQTLAQRSDLRAVQAQPCACVRVRVRVCARVPRGIKLVSAGASALTDAQAYPLTSSALKAPT